MKRAGSWLVSCSCLYRVIDLYKTAENGFLWSTTVSKSLFSIHPTSTDSDDYDSFTMAGDLLFVSNRLPFIVDNAKGVIQASLSSSDLVTALSGIVKPTNIRLFGWPGVNIQDADERKDISNALASNNAVGIFLDEQLAHGYYHRLSSM